jgi:LEA14-like dessication related protein
MNETSIVRKLLTVFAALSLSACATIPGQEPLQVTVADIESMGGEGLELRMMVKLRVQNPNDSPVEYDGVYIKVEVLDRTFATGVSDQRGTVPRFGETIVAVPLTVSTLRVVLGAFDVIGGNQSIEKVNYRLEGKLDGVGWGSHRFHATGQLSLPGAIPTGSEPTR